jgi:mutator protein MutT
MLKASAEAANGTIPNIEVVAAVIERDGLILCAQRKDGGELARKWEFPGGKLESGESRQGALERELDEELAVRIETGAYLMSVQHRYADFSITMHAYLAAITEGDATLREHLAVRWLRRDELRTLDWAPADLPIVERLLETASCPFCRIPLEQRFYDGNYVFGIWDSHPASPGHALLIPKRHAPTWFDASPEEKLELLAAIDAARAAIERNHSPDGYNIGINVGAVAGQTVFHLHVHVIPRYKGDVSEPKGGVRCVISGRGHTW